MKTKSERCFEEFCRQKGIRYKRIAESKTPTPDYDIFVPRRKIVVEVKEITPNKEEKQAQNELAKKKFVFGWFTPGQRIRKKISESVPQIKNRTNHRYPGILVLFDKGFIAGHLDPYDIRVAMCGLETVQIVFPNDSQLSPYSVRTKYGPKRKMTPEHNTSISAIGVLYARRHSSIEMVIYHNMFAGVPLDPMLLNRYEIPQYRLNQSQPDVIADWELFVGSLNLNKSLQGMADNHR
jgi:hypothetical protein